MSLRKLKLSEVKPFPYRSAAIMMAVYYPRESPRTPLASRRRPRESCEPVAPAAATAPEVARHAHDSASLEERRRRTGRARHRRQRVHRTNALPQADPRGSLEVGHRGTMGVTAGARCDGAATSGRGGSRRNGTAADTLECQGQLRTDCGRRLGARRSQTLLPPYSSRTCGRAWRDLNPPTHGFEVRGGEYSNESDASRHFTFRTVTAATFPRTPRRVRTIAIRLLQ